MSPTSGPGPLPAGAGRQALAAEVGAVCAVGLAQGARVLLAVSGGHDSVAMARLVRTARPDLDAHVAHVRHGLRDDAADADVAVATAEALGVPLQVLDVTVEADRDGPEAAARRARYDALGSEAARLRAAAILVGHTAEDQAETVVLRLARGTGVAGLAGMRAVDRLAGTDIALVRPMLRLRRDDVRAVVDDAGLCAVRDPTNDDPDQRRARARTEALPALGRLVTDDGGDVVGALCRLAALARADDDALDALAAGHARRLVTARGSARAVAAAGLAALPPALATRVVRRILVEVRGGLAGLSAADVDRVLHLDQGQAVDLRGGVRVTAAGGWLTAAPADTRVR